MATGSEGEGQSSIFRFDTRQIVVAGIIGGVALFLGFTRLGLIPVPIPLEDEPRVRVPHRLGDGGRTHPRLDHQRRVRVPKIVERHAVKPSATARRCWASAW